ncbi:MAG: DUF2029 domain-containing protein [Dehalococcoidia bacterium]|nr:DUF2029 domain-containing protein [Dehalococcoidia bacterium]
MNPLRFSLRVQRPLAFISLALGLMAACFVVLAPKPGMWEAALILSGPVRALQGLSPYGNAFFYPPWVVGLFLPFAVVPEPVRIPFWYAANYAALLLVSLWLLRVDGVRRPWMHLGWLLLLAPIEWLVNTGQTILPLVLGCLLYMAGEKTKRPWVTGLAFVVFTGKLQLGGLAVLVLGLSHLRRGDLRPLMYGAIFMVLAYAHPLTWTDWPRALLSYTDNVFIIQRLVLLPVALALVWLRPPAGTTAVALACLTALITVPYPHRYDIALLVFPLAWFLARGNVAVVVVALIVPELMNHGLLPDASVLILLIELWALVWWLGCVKGRAEPVPVIQEQGAQPTA